MVYGIAIGTHKLVPNVTVTNHSHQIGTLTISMKSWNKLSADEQKWLWEGSQQATQGNPWWRERGLASHDKLVQELGGNAPAIWKKIKAAAQACKA